MRLEILEVFHLSLIPVRSITRASRGPCLSCKKTRRYDARDPSAWPCGLTDKTLDHGTTDCRLESGYILQIRAKLDPISQRRIFAALISLPT